MKLEVAFKDEQNNNQTVECINVKEGEHGLKLVREGREVAGYIPYNNLERVTPIEDTDS